MGYRVEESDEFKAWRINLRDTKARVAIGRRLERAAAGNLGEVKPLDNISEMKIDLGPGYRLYFTMRRKTIIFILCGGDKSTQKKDIKRAQAMAKEIK
jgi:putative addiction module killer protein